jgi:hypothetical protein
MVLHLATDQEDANGGSHNVKRAQRSDPIHLQFPHAEHHTLWPRPMWSSVAGKTRTLASFDSGSGKELNGSRAVSETLWVLSAGLISSGALAALEAFVNTAKTTEHQKKVQLYIVHTVTVAEHPNKQCLIILHMDVSKSRK